MVKAVKALALTSAMAALVEVALVEHHTMEQAQAVKETMAVLDKYHPVLVLEEAEVLVRQAQ